MSITDTLAWLERNDQQLISELADWLRIPSISTDPQYAKDVRAAALWASKHLEASGFDTKLMETGTSLSPGHPVVYARTPSPKANRPHILFYGHYDVQPADPVDLWDSPPFEPVVKDAGSDAARIVARGASDDKGQVMTFLTAMRAWHETIGLAAGGANITVLLEGEEESGSANLERFLTEHKDLFTDCDVCVISDTGMLGRDKPAITYGVRGLVYTEVTLHGPNIDLHSGMWGGRAPNPASELTKVLSQLWDDSYRITIPGFYDDVRSISDEESSLWDQLNFDQTGALKGIGLSQDADVGERGFAPLEREWARPTCDINGIYAGYTGHGAKTIIPSSATAKVSFRIVADQDPAKVRDAFFAWLNERTPGGCRWTLTDHGGGHAASMPLTSPHLQLATKALRAAADTEPAMIKTGGSIPIAGMLQSLLNMDTVFMGFGLDNDRVHSPNEKFDLACFKLGMRAHAHLAHLLTSGVC